MNYWEIFWTVALIVAGVSFAAITAIVTVRGYQDLRQMFIDLRKQQVIEPGPDR
jgi:hypothetical protein